MANKGLLFVSAVLLLILASGCIQEEVAEEREEEPPFPYDQPTYVYEELIGPSNESIGEEGEAPLCSPPEMSDHCEGKARYHTFECIGGEWQYEVEECAYECSEGMCIHTGCPPCDDRDPCTLDLCSGKPEYECTHIIVPQCKEEGGAQKACAPAAAPGSTIRLDIYPAGTPSSYTGEPLLSGVLKPGEKMWVDKDDSITLVGFELSGTCPKCFYEPVLKWPPAAELKISKDLSGEKSSSYKEEGEFGYICVEGKCRKTGPAGCTEYACTSTMRFVVSEMNANFTCS